MIILAAVLVSCRNPYLADPRLDPSTPLFTHLPVDASSVRFMGPYGIQDLGGGRINNHNGIDIGVTGTMPFYSCAAGVVTGIDLNTGKGRPGTNYRITVQVSSSTVMEYHFEIDGSVSEQERKDNIFVSIGDLVKPGTRLANLLSMGDAAHVHFGTIYNNVNGGKCPLLYFDASTAADFENMYETCPERRPPSRATLCE
jgi:murein DD-endopeptidase MepM/ murein hydrolase activator NlpD